MPGNQPSSAVGDIVSSTSLVADSDADGSALEKAGLSASPSAVPWSLGRPSVGFGCVLLTVELGPGGMGKESS